MTTTNKKITFTLFISFLLVLLISCENFMHGAWVSEELKKQIEYANAPKVTVKMRVDNNDYGDIYPPSVVVAQGDTFTVEFTQKENTMFKYWKITNPQTGEELDENCLVITEERLSENRAEKTIIRKITVAVNSLPEDAEIRPKCYFPSENVPPEFTKFNIAKTEQSAKTAADCIIIEETAALNTFDHYADKQYYGEDADAAAAAVKANIEAHHVNSLWIDLEGFDANSGVDELEIQEKLLWGPSGVKSVDNTVYKKQYPLVADKNNKTGSVAATINHVFKVKEDGVVNVKIILRDKSGNETCKELDLIKDTVCDLKSYIAPAARPAYREENKIKKIADENGKATYNLCLYLSTDKYEPFIKDKNNNSYYDNTYDLESETKDFSGHARLVKLAIGYVGETLTEYAAEDFEYEYEYISYSKLYQPYCMFNVEVDASKDTIIRATLEDTAGNQRVYDSIIPKSITADYVEVTNNNTKFQIYSGGELLKKDVYNAYFVFKGTDNTITTATVNLGSDGFVTCNTFKDMTGTLYIYPLKNISNYVYTLGSNPYVIYQGVQPETVTQLTSDMIPTFTCSVDTAVPNTGIRTVHITYEEGFNFLPNIKYFIAVIKGTNVDDPLLFNTTTFDLPASDEDYHLFVMLKNEINELKMDFDVQYETLTISEDNIPPAIDSSNTNSNIKYKEIVFPDTRIVYLHKDKNGNTRTFDASGLMKDEDGNMTIKYVVSSSSSLLETGIDWTDTSIVKEYKQKASDNTLYLPFDGNYNKYCYVHLVDTSENYTDYLFEVENTHIEGSPEFKILNEGRKIIELRFPSSTNLITSANITTFYYNGSEGEWQLIDENRNFLEDMVGYYNIEYNWPNVTDYTENYNKYHNYRFIYNLYNSGSYSYRYPFDGSTTTGPSKSFVKTYIWGSSIQGGSSFYYIAGYNWDTIYFYAPYYLANSGAPTIKNYYEGALGVNVLSDKPCLVHTLYCSVDLGDKQAWLNGGIEAKVQTSSSTFTYEEPDNIPAGKYYTTIIHFADGEYCMTSVKRK